MKYNMSICPTTPTAEMSGWFILNTYLQKKLGIAIHLEIYDNFDAQRAAFHNGDIDFIFANPFDATLLMRELNFRALNKPNQTANEVVIIGNASSVYKSMSDLKPNIKIATANDPAINLIAMILLESVDIDANNSQTLDCSSFIVATKQVLNNEADIAFLPKEVYEKLSSIIKQQLHCLISSEISVIHHIFAASAKSQEVHKALAQVLCELDQDDSGKNILNTIGFPSFSSMPQEEAEFMIDLMDTLK
jgi:phosphonate transport system substrate-binding protein